MEKVRFFIPFGNYAAPVRFLDAPDVSLCSAKSGGRSYVTGEFRIESGFLVLVYGWECVSGEVFDW